MEPMSTRARRGASSERLTRLLAGASALGLALSACQTSDATRVDASALAAADELSGSLRVPLVSADAGQYRLKNAVFDIARSGVVLLSLSSELDPGALELSTPLDPGSYEVRLLDGWIRERLDPVASAPLRAALISPNPVSFAVRNDRVTTVVFTFTTGAGTVTFGAGSLNVRFGVVDPASLASCDAAQQSGCGAGQHCLLAGDAGQTFCATPGPLEVGAACNAEQCVRGAQCLSLDPDQPGQSTCTLLCNPAAPPFGCDCRGLRFTDAVGVCGSPPASACDLLVPTSCDADQTCQYPGGSFGVCGTPGGVVEGGACFGEECQAGLDCFGDDPAFGFSGTCFRFCDLAAPACEFCFDVGTGRVGRCFF